MSVWKEGMIKRYSDFEKIDDDTFGLRPPRVICSTSNSHVFCFYFCIRYLLFSAFNVCNLSV